MKRISIVLCAVIILYSCISFSQVALHTGSIYGKVLDEQGTPLPGVTITLETNGAAPEIAYSGEAGSYLFPALVPGAYSVSFAMQGFTEVRQEDVRITTGKTVNLEVTLKNNANVNIEVSAEVPIVDTRSTSISTSFNQDYFQNVPTARDPWVIIDQTPGIDLNSINVGGNQSGQQSQFASKGGTFEQTVWSYDGVDITFIASQGASPLYYDFDSFEEIQITTGGQDPSIDTGGVVINFITKRGGNSWAGTASGYFDNHSLQTDNVDQALIDQNFLSPARVNAIWELGGNFGGPLVKDKAWIWGAYRYQKISNFTATILVSPDPVAIQGHVPQDIKLGNINLKANASYNQENEGSYQFTRDKKEFDHRFYFDPSQQATDTTWLQQSPNNMFNVEHSFIPNSNWFLNAKFNYLKTVLNVAPYTGIGADAQPTLRANGDFFLENGGIFSQSHQPMASLTMDASYFRQNWGGDHEFKFGFAYKHASISTISQYGGDIQLTDYAGHRGDQSAGSGVAFLRYETDDQYDWGRIGLYASDTWRTGRLTMNLGLRFDRSVIRSKAADAPANTVAPDLFPALHFGGDDTIPPFKNLSPRLGATFDLKGDGKTIVRGNYARYYDPVGITEVTFTNPLATYTGIYTYYNDLNGDGSITRNELCIEPSSVCPYYGFTPVGGFIPGNPEATVAQHSEHRFLDPNLSPPITDEFLIGFERQISKDISFAATYTHRKYSNLEDQYVPGITSNDYICAPVTVTSPSTGESFSTNACDLPAAILAQDRLTLLNVPGRDRSYDGVELTVNKRMSNHWMVRLSGVFQNQELHYANNSTVFPGSFQNPTNIPFTNNTWAAENLGHIGGGIFVGSRWSLKTSTAYQFVHDVTVGAYFKSVDGNIVPIRALVRGPSGPNTINVILEKFDAERLPTVTYMDLQVAKGFSVGKKDKLTASIDIFNLFNTNSTLIVNRVATSFQFRDPLEIVAPRIVRLGLRYSF